MSTSIYYFTGTGNSLKIAKDLNNTIEDSELIPIAQLWELENPKSKSEKVGFIFPLYYSGLPKIVVDFINKLDLSKSNYIFTIITNAGDINEQPLQQLNKMLERKLKRLNAGFFITMPNNYIIGFDIHSEVEQKEFFKNATMQIESISKVIKNNKENLTQEIFEKDLSQSEGINKKFRGEVNRSDTSFYVDDNCSRCGLCERVCPVNNIILIEGLPYWQHKCQQCLACINFCPERSIQFDLKTLKTQRYHHPEITIQEIINQKKIAI